MPKPQANPRTQPRQPAKAPKRRSGAVRVVIPDTPAPDDAFSLEATDVLRELRRTTATVLGACRGVDRAVEVSAKLGIDRSLAWKLWRVGQGPGACPSPAHIPGKQGFLRFLDAAANAGVDPVLIRDAKSAYERLEQLSETYAGDRASAGNMLGALTEEGRTRLETSLRRDAFRANAFFLAVQAEAMYQLDVILPRGDNPRAGLDVVRVRGHYALRRNRPNVPWIVARSTAVDAQGPSANVRRSPLRAPASAEDLPDRPFPVLLPEFSTDPMPTVVRRLVAGVTVEDELQPGPVGQVGAVTIVTGERVSRDELAAHADPGRARARTDAVTMSVTTPCERLCYDVVIPEGLAAGPIRLRLHSTVQMELPYLRGPEAGVIPVSESFEDLGDVHLAPPVPEIARHAELLRWTMSRALSPPGAGGDGPASQAPPMRFRLWRARMRFPPIPSCLAAAFDLA